MNHATQTENYAPVEIAADMLGKPLLAFAMLQILFWNVKNYAKIQKTTL